MRLQRQDVIAQGEPSDRAGGGGGEQARARRQGAHLILMRGQQVETGRAGRGEHAVAVPVVTDAAHLPATGRAPNRRAQAAADQLMAETDPDHLAPGADQPGDALAQLHDPVRIGEGVVAAAGQHERVIDIRIRRPFAGGDMHGVEAPLRAAAAAQEIGIETGEPVDMRRDAARQAVILQDADAPRRQRDRRAGPAGRGHSASAAHQPLDQAHWKL